MAKETDPCVRYAVKCPFPDADMYCFVLDNCGKVRYYNSREEAELAAKEYKDATVVKTGYYGFQF